jgi:hypothetical protein
VDLDGDFFLTPGMDWMNEWIMCTFFLMGLDWEFGRIWVLDRLTATDSIDRVSRCRCVRATAVPFLSRFMIASMKASQLNYVPFTFLHMCRLLRLIVFGLNVTVGGCSHQR